MGGGGRLFQGWGTEPGSWQLLEAQLPACPGTAAAPLSMSTGQERQSWEHRPPRRDTCTNHRRTRTHPPARPDEGNQGPPSKGLLPILTLRLVVRILASLLLLLGCPAGHTPPPLSLPAKSPDRFFFISYFSKLTKQTEHRQERQEAGRGVGTTRTTRDGPESLHEKQALGRKVLAATSFGLGPRGARSVPSPRGYRLLKMTSSQHGQLLMNWRV